MTDPSRLHGLLDAHAVARRREHYERAFASMLREQRIPYVSVDEAKRALLPPDATLRAPESLTTNDGREPLAGPLPAGRSLKSFDFVVYGEARNLLVEVKGRRGPSPGALRRSRTPRIENWATRDDLASLGAWEQLFGDGFTAALVFVYECDGLPDEDLFPERIELDARWYGVRAVPLGDFVRAMKTRSPRWGTMDVPAERFLAISTPLTALAGAHAGA